MSIVPPGEAADPEGARAEVLHRVYLQGGWIRYLPPSAVHILGFMVTRGPLTRDELDAELSGRADSAGGLTSPAWEPLVQWTDEELRKLDENFPQLADADNSTTAEQAMAEDRQERAARIAEMDAASADLGLAPVRTMADVLEFMVACTVLTCAADGGSTRYALNPRAALPTEVLTFSDGERAAEDNLRWSQLHTPVAQDIMGLFEPDDPGRIHVINTSLRLLATELDADIETVRAGLAVLLQEPDFTASRDPERIPDHEMFEIRVDWSTFIRTRISVRLCGLDDGE